MCGFDGDFDIRFVQQVEIQIEIQIIKKIMTAMPRTMLHL